MATINGIELFVTEETEDITNVISSKAVEEGYDISDHIYQEPITLNIKFVVRANGSDIYNKLLELRDSTKVYQYQGVSKKYNNMGIQSITIPRDKNIEDGFEGILKLKEVKVVEQVTNQVKFGKDKEKKLQIKKDNKDTPKRDYWKTNIPKE